MGNIIGKPKQQEQYPDRAIDCEEALEPLFQDLVAAALAHGWSPDETRRALRRLIAAQRITDLENAKVEADLAIFRALERAKP